MAGGTRESVIIAATRCQRLNPCRILSGTFWFQHFYNNLVGIISIMTYVWHILWITKIYYNNYWSDWHGLSPILHTFHFTELVILLLSDLVESLFVNYYAHVYIFSTEKFIWKTCNAAMFTGGFVFKTTRDTQAMLLNYIFHQAHQWYIRNVAGGWHV